MTAIPLLVLPTEAAGQALPRALAQTALESISAASTSLARRSLPGSDDCFGCVDWYPYTRLQEKDRVAARAN